MAYPFAFLPGFRQQLLLAIGTTSLASAAAVGCTTERRTDQPPSAPAPAQMSVPAQMQTPMTAPAPAGGTKAPAASSGGMTAQTPMTPTPIAGKAGSAGASEAGASGMTAQAGVSGMAGQAGASVAGMGGQAGAPPLPMCSRPASPPECFPRAQMESQAKYGCGMISNPPARFTDAEVQTHFLPNGCLEQPLACNGCCNLALTEGVPQGDGSCCYTFCSESCCGRPLIVDGRARLATLERRSDWLQAFAGTASSSHWDARIAHEWLEDARMEHASVASFARFTLDLLAFGAPSELVEQAQRAALDEVEHARMCFGLAARYGARERGPGQLSAADVRVAPSLWHAACAAFEEGCIGETLAALQAHAAHETSSDPEVRNTLAQIAQQEAAHAELAWRFVSWSVARLGPQLARELENRFAQLCFAPTPTPTPTEHEPAEAIAALHAAGRLTGADKHRITLEGLREVIAPSLAALVGSTPLQRLAV